LLLVSAARLGLVTSLLNLKRKGSTVFISLHSRSVGEPYLLFASTGSVKSSIGEATREKPVDESEGCSSRVISSKRKANYL
jgi:hypothetical protein